MKIENEFGFSPIEVIALSDMNGHHKAYHHIMFVNRDGQEVKRLVRSSLLNNKSRLRELLSDCGYADTLDDVTWERVYRELKKSNPAARVTISQRPGWVNDVYLCASGEVIKGYRNSDQINDLREPLLSPEAKIKLPMEMTAGSLDEWREKVAVLALHSSRMMLGLCASLSGLIIRFSGVESGGFHFFGDSSLGKSHCLLMAASVYGDKDFVVSWSATEKAFEEMAEGRNDSVKIMDELKTLDHDPVRAAQLAQKLVYQFAEGRGKSRGVDYQATSSSWNGVFLSAGEKSLNEHATSGGINRMLGETVRVIDVPADTGSGYGLFDALPESYTSSEALIGDLRSACEMYHGHAKLAFVRKVAKKLAKDPEGAMSSIRKHMAHFMEHQPPTASAGMGHRIAKRFALAYAAGALGVRFKLLPFTEEQVLSGISACYLAALQSMPKTFEQKVDDSRQYIMHWLVNSKSMPLVSSKKPSISKADLDELDGYRYITDGVKVIAVKREVIELLVPDATVRRRVLSEIHQSGALLKDAGNKSTRPLSIKTTDGRVCDRRVCFAFDRLPG